MKKLRIEHTSASSLMCVVFVVLFGWLCSAMIILAIVAEVYFVHWHVVDFIIALASWFVNSLSSACNIFGFCDFT